MPALKNSAALLRSKPAFKRNRQPEGAAQILSVTLCFLASAAIMGGVARWVYLRGYTLYFGDAEAHLNIARRMVDSRTPGWEQIGTTWLPVPHLLMLPLVRHDWLWTSGLAGVISSAVSMAIAAMFLFAALLAEFGTLPASIGAAVFLLNPNTLYLGSIPMSEPPFFAAFFALLFFAVRFMRSSSWWSVAGMSIAALAASLTRYEAWLAIPVVALIMLIVKRRHNWAKALCFLIISASGPALWLAHNWWYYGDALYFYRGAWSALAIQGHASYPGEGNWPVAAQYFAEASRLVAGIPALVIAAAGLVFILIQRMFAAALMLAALPLFYIWSIHSSGTPIFVPTLWPHSFYNTRYGLAMLPLVASGCAAVAAQSRWLAGAVILAVFAPFGIHPTEPPVTWRESDVNSRARRAWTKQTAEFLRLHRGPEETIFTSFNDLTGIYRTMGLPLRYTLTEENHPEWEATLARPDLFLHEDWAVVTGGDAVQTVIDRVWLHGPRYELSRRIIVPGAPVIEIYHRLHENPVL